MNPKYKDGVIESCLLTKPERKALDGAFSTCAQLAYHYKGTDLGDGMSGVVVVLNAVMADPTICPTAGDVEQPKGD